MDRRERMDNPIVALRAALRGWQAGIWTALPGVVVDYDAAKLTASVQLTIQPKVRQSDGTVKDVSISVLKDCPVVFPQGGGFLLTFPLRADDPGLVIFSSRCIDAWWQNGGVQPQAEVRMHDLSDGFFLPGPFSQAHLPANVSATAVQLRSWDGLSYIEVDPEGNITLEAPSGAAVEGSLEVNGDLTVSGALNLTGDFVGQGGVSAVGDIIAGSGTADQVSLLGHQHTGVFPGSGLSGPPRPGS